MLPPRSAWQGLGGGPSQQYTQKGRIRPVWIKAPVRHLLADGRRLTSFYDKCHQL